MRSTILRREYSCEESVSILNQRNWILVVCDRHCETWRGAWPFGLPSETLYGKEGVLAG